MEFSVHRLQRIVPVLVLSVAATGVLPATATSAADAIRYPNGKVVRSCLFGGTCPYTGMIAKKGRSRAGTAFLWASPKRVSRANFALRSGTRDSGCKSSLAHTDYGFGDVNPMTGKKDKRVDIKRDRFAWRHRGGGSRSPFDETFNGRIADLPGGNASISGTWSSSVTAGTRTGRARCHTGGARKYRAHTALRTYSGALPTGGWALGETDWMNSKLWTPGTFNDADFGVTLVQIPTRCVDATGRAYASDVTFSPAFTTRQKLGEETRIFTSSRVQENQIGAAAKDISFKATITFPGLTRPTGNIGGTYELSYVKRDADGNGSVYATCATDPGQFSVPGVPVSAGIEWQNPPIPPEQG